MLCSEYAVENNKICKEKNVLYAEKFKYTRIIAEVYSITDEPKHRVDFDVFPTVHHSIGYFFRTNFNAHFNMNMYVTLSSTCFGP